MPTASGANSVASALGNRTRRDPGAAVRTYHEGLKPALKTGTFYLAGNRNFLLGRDMDREPPGRWISGHPPAPVETTLYEWPLFHNQGSAPVWDRLASRGTTRLTRGVHGAARSRCRQDAGLT